MARKRHSGHPARQTREVRRRKRKEQWLQPDATEQSVQEANRRMRQAVHEAREDEGFVTGPLTVAAEHLVEQLQRAHGLDGEEHRAAIIGYLVGCWGDVARAFPERPEPPGYHEWREDSRQRILAAVADQAL